MGERYAAFEQNLKYFLEQSWTGTDFHEGAPTPIRGDVLFAEIGAWTLGMIKEYAHKQAKLGKPLRVQRIQMSKSWLYDQEEDVTLGLAASKQRVLWRVRVSTHCGTASEPTSLLFQVIDLGGKQPRHVYNAIGSVSHRKESRGIRTVIRRSNAASC